MHLDPILNLSRLLSSVYQLDFAKQITENFNFSQVNYLYVVPHNRSIDLSSHIQKTKKRLFEEVFIFEKLVGSTLFNRYRRGLETCPQAKRSKTGHAMFFSFFRRVRATTMSRRRVENTCVHIFTFSPVSVKYGKLFYWFSHSERGRIKSKCIFFLGWESWYMCKYSIWTSLN